MPSNRPTLLLLALLATSPADLTAQQPANTGHGWTVGATGNIARYRVREQLAGVEFENDAVGETRDVSGGVRFDTEGHVVPADSRLTIGLRTLASDKDRRDGYLQRRTLTTAEYPNATLVITGFEGLPTPLPETGALRFTLLGDLTIRDRTFPTEWEVTATIEGDHLTGAAHTAFTFEEAGLDKPSVMVVLSVADTIVLEYDFHFIKAP